MTLQTEQLLQQVENDLAANKNELDATAQRWETAARAGCASVDELETQLDKLKTISKRLALRRGALEQQLAADVDARRVADVDALTVEVNATAESIAQQYKALSVLSDKMVAAFDQVLADGQKISNDVHKLKMLECDAVPAAIMALDLASYTTKDKAGEFYHKQQAVYALSERIVNNATQRIQPKR